MAYLDVLDRAQAYSICVGLSKDGNISELQRDLVELYRYYSVYDSIGLTECVSKINEQLDGLISTCNSSVQRDIKKFLNDKSSPIDVDEMTVEINSSLRQILEKQTQISQDIKNINNKIHTRLEELNKKAEEIKKLSQESVSLNTKSINNRDQRSAKLISQAEEFNFTTIEELRDLLKNDPELQEKISNTKYTLNSRVLYLFNHIPLGTKLIPAEVNIAMKTVGSEKMFMKEYLRKLSARGKLQFERGKNNYSRYFIINYSKIDLVPRGNSRTKSTNIMKFFKNGTRLTANQIGDLLGVPQQEGLRRNVREQLLILYENGKLNR
jgi:hypothetical protein